MEHYIKYLSFIDEKLQNFFSSQKPYIFCEKGCAKCCKNAQFPYSCTEIKYLLSGIEKLDKSLQNKIEENLQEVMNKKNKFKGKKFLYDCPFLIENVCSVYEYRGVLCRAFGLMTTYPDRSLKAPFCCFDGLNYSNVLNMKTKKVSPRKFKKLCVMEEPCCFNVSYSFLTNPEFEKEYALVFGEKKPLINWFLEESDS